MKMKSKEVKELLLKMIEMEKVQSTWLDKVPNEISSAFFDNTYTTSKSQQIDLLLNYIFGNWAEDVSYFLYEPSPHNITTKNGDYIINNVDEYIDYMVAEGFLEDNR